MPVRPHLAQSHRMEVANAVNVKHDPLIPRLLAQVLPGHEHDAFLDAPNEYLADDIPRQLAESGCPACRGKVLDLLYEMGAKP